MVHFIIFSIWTKLNGSFLWSIYHFSLFGPNWKTSIIGPFHYFLHLDQIKWLFSLVHLPLFFIWTKLKDIYNWSISLFSPFGPIQNTSFSGPIISFLYLDQYEIRSSLVQLSLFLNLDQIMLFSYLVHFIFFLYGPTEGGFLYGLIHPFLILDPISLPQHKKAPRGRRLFIGLLIV